MIKKIFKCGWILPLIIVACSCDFLKDNGGNNKSDRSIAHAKYPAITGPLAEYYDLESMSCKIKFEHENPLDSTSNLIQTLNLKLLRKNLEIDIFHDSETTGTKEKFKKNQDKVFGFQESPPTKAKYLGGFGIEVYDKNGNLIEFQKPTEQLKGKDLDNMTHILQLKEDNMGYISFSIASNDTIYLFQLNSSLEEINFKNKVKNVFKSIF